MNRLLCSCLLAAMGSVSLAAVDSDTTTPTSVSGSLSKAPARVLADLPFELSWDLQLPAAITKSWILPTTPELAYFHLVNDQVHAIEHRTGKTRWVSNLGMPGKAIWQPSATRVVRPGAKAGETITTDRVYVICDDHLICIDGNEGSIVFRYFLGRSGQDGFEPCTAPFAQGEGENVRILVGDWTGRMRAIGYNPNNGQGFPVWQYNIYATPTTTVLAGMDGLTYIGDSKGNLHAFGTEREIKWTFPTGTVLRGIPGIRGVDLFVPAETGVLHILNRLSGRELGHIPLGITLERQPFTFDSEPTRVYVWTHEGDKFGLYAVHAEHDNVPHTQYERETVRLAPLWHLEGVSNLVCSTPTHLFLTAPKSSVIYALDRSNGQYSYRWNIDGDRAGGNGSLGKGGPVRGFTQYQDNTDQNRSIITWDDKAYVVSYRLFGQFEAKEARLRK